MRMFVQDRNIITNHTVDKLLLQTSGVCWSLITSFILSLGVS